MGFYLPPTALRTTSPRDQAEQAARGCHRQHQHEHRPRGGAFRGCAVSSKLGYHCTAMNLSFNLILEDGQARIGHIVCSSPSLRLSISHYHAGRRHSPRGGRSGLRSRENRWKDSTRRMPTKNNHGDKRQHRADPAFSFSRGRQFKQRQPTANQFCKEMEVVATRPTSNKSRPGLLATARKNNQGDKRQPHADSACFPSRGNQCKNRQPRTKQSFKGTGAAATKPARKDIRRGPFNKNIWEKHLGTVEYNETFDGPKLSLEEMIDRRIQS